MSSHHDYPPRQLTEKSGKPVKRQQACAKVTRRSLQQAGGPLQERSYSLVTPVLIVIFFVLGYLAVTYYLHRVPLKWFPIKRVELYGQLGHFNRKKLVSLIQDKPLYFLTLNSKQLGLQLQQSPWVRDLTIKKVWPSTLRILVQEYQPVASWNHRRLLDRSGLVFVKPPEKLKLISALPQLVGPEEQELSVWASYVAFNAIMQSVHLRIRTISLSDNGQWRLVLNDGASVYIGSAQAQMRLSRFAELYALLAKKESAIPVSFDLRYPYAIAAQLKR